jgi:ubiquinone/menaquinone biosynthesis C-methylase UbiE
VVWKLAHPIWPPLSLGPPEELRDTVRRAYSERLTVELYGELDTGEVDAALSSDERHAIQQFKPGSRILDIGCGTGREAFALASLGYQVTALDISPGMLEIARRNAERVGAEMQFVLASLGEFDAPPNSFDGVYVSQEVYSYIPGRQHRVEALKRIRRVLADDGVLLLFQSVSSQCPWGRSFLVGVLRRISRGLRRRDVSEPGDAWTAEGVYHLSFKHFFFSARELHSEIVEGGFRVENVVGFCRICRPTFL